MHPERASKIFNKIAAHDPEFVCSALGGVGLKLVALFDNLGNHPETDSLFFEESDLALCDLLDLAEHADKSGMRFFAEHLPFLADRQASETFKRSRTPRKNGCSARFFRKPIRDEARSTRRVQKVFSRSFARSIHKLWHSLPSDFSVFFRGHVSVNFSDVPEKLSQMGCHGLSLSAADLRERFHNPPEAFGYKKLGVLDACRILAKANCFVLAGGPEDPKVVARSVSGCFEYSPLIVPLHFFKSVPESVRECLEDAEHNRSLYFDAVFDNYLVVVPFVGSRCECESATEVNFSDCSDYISAVSLGGGSVVLGERDGKCYFICEWN